MGTKVQAWNFYITYGVDVTNLRVARNQLGRCFVLSGFVEKIHQHFEVYTDIYPSKNIEVFIDFCLVHFLSSAVGNMKC